MGRRLGGTVGTVRLTVALLAAAALAACTNAPPPPLVTTPVASTTPNRPVNPGEVVVGVDTVAGGFNPHKVTDQSAATTALAAMVLPSVFRPGPDGTLRLDTTVMVSAEVTRAEPYTVSYQIRPEASWADSAPIAAEDFVYLWQQVRSAPGSIGAAGYQLISDITARDAGKIVEVTFTKPYPGWRTLFSGLVPAHLLKDAPGGWANALKDNFPTTGGPYAMKTLDRDRGEIVLERNDRYWDQPPTLDRIVLRRGDPAGVVDALRAGHDQLALIQTSESGALVLNGLGSTVSTRGVARSTVVSLVLRPGGPDLSTEGVRRALVALLDRQALITTGTGAGPAAKLRADAQVLAPTAPGYAPTLPAGPPAKPDRDLAQLLLGDAGYAKIEGAWTRADRPLSLIIAAPADRQSYVDIANEVRLQLAAEGIQARVVTAPADELITRLTAEPGAADAVNLVVAAQPTGGDPATAMATNFGCAAGQDGAAATTPLSPIGSCDPAIQPTIDAALTGAMSLSDALSVVEPVLWRQAVSVPLYQEAETLAIRPEMSGVDAGPPFAGPFAGAADWRRAVP
ncbi:MAG TPA: ABC transporter family substrate-binding protein [Actinophytocola sp.]|uniref:ABC transporter family substrate-binding protein n=1 Tax=Actinophytocola sp. TaxID=1872138 RepID=UPI002DDD699C|nr:ABC transporter family substrate-binding protein [Actinophytocola sp.]HEV2781933.1 ABC transporter family substrate-binding protein [Actinophytocola sp.]